MKIKYTIFTPTYNRAKLLPRAYKSLIKQTYKDFIWLIVDDGSDDNTKSLVDSWQNEGLLNIEYIYKNNGGKYSAMILAFNSMSTEFSMILDSDDELTEDALQTIENHWNDIKSSNLYNEIVSIRANTIYATSGEVVGNYKLDHRQNYIDTTWHTFHLKMNVTNELLSCEKVGLLQKVFNPSEEFWMNSKITNIQPGVFWARYNKFGKMRYVNANLRVYHLDANNSIMRNTNPNNGYYNELVSNKYFLSENMEFWHFAPIKYLNYVVKYVLCGYYLNIGLKVLFENAKGFKFKVWLLSTLPVSMIALLYFKFVKKKFWRDSI